MFVTLPESRARRTRRVGGTVASVLIHAAIIAGAVGLTMTGSAGARVAPPVRRDSIVYVVPVDHRPTSSSTARGSSTPTTSVPAPRRLPSLDIILGKAPPVLDEFREGFPTPAELPAGEPGIQTTGSVSAPGSGTPGSVVGEYETDRAPRILGTPPEPRYPDALRAVGITGGVVVQFVVDTSGRAEPGSLEVLSATRAEFAESVRAALSRFRFGAGEAGGRRVRTRVELPFDFTLR